MFSSLAGCVANCNLQWVLGKFLSAATIMRSYVGHVAVAAWYGDCMEFNGWNCQLNVVICGAYIYGGGTCGGAHICDEGHGVVAAYLRNGSRGVEALA